MNPVNMAASDATHIFAAIPLIIRTTIKSRIGILICLALSLFLFALFLYYFIIINLWIMYRIR